MVNSLSTKVGHFLNEDGELPADLPGPARNLAEFICSLVRSVTSHSFEALVPTGVPCRRRPKRKRTWIPFMTAWMHFLIFIWISKTVRIRRENI